MNASLYREGACVSLSFQSEQGSWSGRTHVLCVCVILSLSFVLFLLVCVCVLNCPVRRTRRIGAVITHVEQV